MKPQSLCVILDSWLKIESEASGWYGKASHVRFIATVVLDITTTDNDNVFVISKSLAV